MRLVSPLKGKWSLSKLIPESIREEYSYCPETGAITKIKYVPKSILKVGDIAKSVTRNGKYFKLGHKGKEMHGEFYK